MSDDVGWREARAAHRSARLAPDFPWARRSLRPRGVIPLVRSRAPLTLLFWTAAREGRLVWQDADGFALLERPRHRPSRGGTLLIRAARFADHRWEMLLLGVPPFVLLAAVVPVTLLGAPLAGLVLVILALTHASVMLGSSVVRLTWLLVAPFFARVSAEDNAIANRPFDHWTLAFSHEAVPYRRQAFPNIVLSRLHRTIRRDFDEKAADDGVQPGLGTLVDEPLFCVLDGVTGPELREVLEEAAEPGAGERSLFLTAGGLPARPVRRLLEAGGFVVLYAVGIAMCVLVVATVVPGWERAACAPDCAGRPADFGSALRWILQRLLLRDPPDITPATDRVAVLGWLVSVAALMFLPVAALCLRQFLDAERRQKRAYDERHPVTNASTRILIMVATTGERRAMLEAVAKANGETHREWHLDHQVVLRQGSLAGSEILLCRALTQGAKGPGGATMAAAQAIDAVRPHYVILTGIGFGLKDDQKPGEVMVATQIRDLDPRRMQEDGEFSTGDRVTPSTLLLSRADAAEARWAGAKVHFGPMLSASVLSRSDAHRARLKAEHPDAIGGEMEASGIYAAAAPLGIHWFMAKAISDRGDGSKNDDHQDLAARNAAAFVVAMIQAGGMIDPP